MTLAAKRKVIEILMCCGDPGCRLATWSAADALGYGQSSRARNSAYEAWSKVEGEPDFCDDWTQLGMSLAYTETAYRIIESDPVLRREWFGR